MSSSDNRRQDSSRAHRLNQNSLCKTLNRTSLHETLAEELEPQTPNSDFWNRSLADQAVFIPHEDLATMASAVKSIERAAALPGFQNQVLSEAPSVAKIDPGPLGAFMGYDFHLTATGPQLIEVNTNAGGAFINAALARAQIRCCSGKVDPAWIDGFDGAVVTMFQNEWRRQRKGEQLRTVAIVDDDPQNQYLYPEFQLAAALLERHGLIAKILAPDELSYHDNRLWHGRETVGVVYNRLVDFTFDEKGHRALRQAWLEGGAVITPHPRAHALLANKRNLIYWSDGQRLSAWGLGPEDAAFLRKVVPHTVLVTEHNADALWRDRRQLFFKPLAGHGSKGAYRGSKLTRGTFSTLRDGRHVAQTYVPPSERAVIVDGVEQLLKVDVRLYTYNGQLVLPAARLYRGQTTNFRTPGGGFAPVFVA